MTEPQPLAGSIASLITRFPPGHRINDLGHELARQKRNCDRRRAAVLKHPDLARRLTEPPIGYSRPAIWNGWIPPATANEFSEPELLRSPQGRANQLGHYATGEIPNDSPRRAALLEISKEAWEREHPG